MSNVEGHPVVGFGCMSCIAVERRMSLSASDKCDCGHHPECIGCYTYHDRNIALKEDK